MGKTGHKEGNETMKADTLEVHGKARVECVDMVYITKVHAGKVTFEVDGQEFVGRAGDRLTVTLHMDIVPACRRRR